MKLSEIKGEKAIEVFADLLDPVSKILSDEDVLKSIQGKEKQVVVIQKMLKSHTKEIIEIMAILDGTPVEEYEVDFVTLPMKLIEIFNDEAVIELFTLQGQKEESTSSGSATANTKGKKA